MQQSLLRQFALAFIEEPGSYWPDDTYFHRRNREKAQRAIRKIQKVSPASDFEVAEQLVDLTKHRAVVSSQTLFVMSNGSSGCHYVGELLDGLVDFVLTDEIYLPPRLLSEIENSPDVDAHLAVDLLNLLHTGCLEPEQATRTIVNIGHLRPDATPRQLRALGASGQFVLLLRNPFDVATSRAFRKADYRKAVEATDDDDAYLLRQARNSRSFLSRASNERWDHVIRYESLREEPLRTLRDLFLVLGHGYNHRATNAVVNRYDLKRTRGNSRSVNVNTAPRQALTAEQGSTLTEVIGDAARDYGYAVPADVSTALISSRSDPKPQLWLPLYAHESHYNAKAYELLRSGQISVFRSFEVVDLPTEPEWTEDPLESKTWRLYYHNLGWLLALSWGIEHGEDPEEDLHLLKSLALNYLRNNITSSPRDEMVWDDHSSADRLSILSYLSIHHLFDACSQAELELLVQSLAVHIERMCEFYASKKWIDSNHGLFHAMALTNAGISLNPHPLAKAAMEPGIAYLRDVVEALVDPSEGVSIEQSMAYHSINLLLLRRIAEFSKTHALSLDETIHKLTARMIEFNYCVRLTGNVAPAIGDTAYGDLIPAGALEPQDYEIPTPHTNYVLTQSIDGTPFPALRTYKSIGLSVFRHKEAFTAGEPVTRAFFTHPTERSHHGHYDALSFYLHLNGRDVFIDSGGPYAYGNPTRFRYFMASRAHNVILLNGEDHKEGSELLYSRNLERGSVVAATHRGYAPAELSRAVLHLDDEHFFVVDASSNLTTPGAFTRCWHLPPDHSVLNLADSEADLFVQDDMGNSIAAVQLLGSKLTHRISDCAEGEPEGWVTARLGESTPAPVLLSETETEQLFMVTYIRPSESDPLPVEVSPDSLRIHASGVQIEIAADHHLTLREIH